MKFRFLGDVDCPDWILSSISILAKMSSIRINLLAKQIILKLLGKPINYEKIHRITHSTRIQLSDSDIESLISSLHFILFNATKYNIPPEILSIELEQLGLPKDIVQSIIKQYNINQNELYDYQTKQVLSLNSINSINYRIDYILASNFNYNLNNTNIRFSINTNKTQQSQEQQPVLPNENDENNSNNNNNNSGKDVNFSMSLEKFQLFYSELKAAKALIDSINK